MLMRIKLDLEFHVEDEKADQIPAQFGNALEYLIGDIVADEPLESPILGLVGADAVIELDGRTIDRHVIEPDGELLLDVRDAFGDVVGKAGSREEAGRVVVGDAVSEGAPAIHPEDVDICYLPGSGWIVSVGGSGERGGFSG
jgi:hypothetical protein